MPQTDYSQYEKKYGLPAGLLNAIRMQESGGNANAVSPKGAQGLFQFMPETAKSLGIDPLNESQAAEGAAKYIKQNLDRFGTIDLALAAYNAGPGNVAKHKGIPPFKETQKYVPEVLARLKGGSGEDVLTGGSGEDILAPSSKITKEQAMAELAKRKTGSSVKNKITKEQAMAEIEKRKTAAPEKQGRTGLEKAVNLGAAYIQGRTFGAGPKIAAAVGTLPAKAAAEGIELVTGKKAPSVGEIYRSGVDLYSEPVKAAREDNPVLALGAELIGGGKSAIQFGKSSLGGKVAGIPGRVSGVLQKMGVGGKAADLLGKSAVGGVLAETGARLYQAAEAPVGQEAKELTGAKVPVAGIIGAGLPVVGAVSGVVGKKLQPAISKEKKIVVDLAKKHGIDVSLDKLSDSKFYKTLISEGESVPFSGSQKRYDKVQKQLNNAVAKTFGQESDSITPEVISKAYDDIGSKFQSFTSGKRFTPGSEFYTSIDDIANNASFGHYGKDGTDFLQTNLDRIKNIIDENGVVKGDRLDKLRREFAKLSRDRYDDIGNLADDLESVLSDIISDSDPKIAKEITKAKYQYKNLKTVQRLALKDQVEGNIRPALLTQAVKTKFGEDAFAKGKAGDLGELARVSQFLKLDIPNSGTAQRTAARHILTGNLGTAPFLSIVNPIAGAAQVAASGIAMAGNRMIQSRNYNQDIINRALTNNLPVPFLGSTAGRSAGVLTGATTGILQGR